jgi:hypothetical protein
MNVPPMPEPLFRAATSDFSIDHLLFERDEQPKRAKLYPESTWLLGQRIPPFQRPLVWTERQKIRFIESAWTGLHLGTYVVNRLEIRNDGRAEPVDRWLIDGQQRLSAIADYANDAFPVFGAKFSEITPAERRRFEQVSFPCSVTRLRDENALRDLYDRLNFGGTPHEENQRAVNGEGDRR